MLLKVFEVTTDSTPNEEIKVVTIAGAAFTAGEKALFASGEPLHATNTSIHLWARRLNPNEGSVVGYVASLSGVISDATGDTGFDIAISTLKDRNDGRNQTMGISEVFEITVLIANN